MTKISISKTRQKGGYLTGLLENYLIRKSGHSYPRSRVIRPSSIRDCPRKIVCDILGFLPPEEITPRKQRIFDNGDSVHTRYLKYYLPRLGIAAKILATDRKGKPKVKDFIEISLKDDDYWIKCRPDAVIINRNDDNKYYVLEIKSIRSDLFDAMEYPSEAYLQQIHLYMHVTKVPRAIVFYENKDNQDTKEFVIHQDDKLLEQLLAKIRQIQKYVVDYINDKKLPAKCDKHYCYACRELKL